MYIYSNIILISQNYEGDEGVNRYESRHESSEMGTKSVTKAA